MKKTDEIALEIANLSISKRLPATFIELHNIVWKCFYLGRDYELQCQKGE